MNNIPIIDPSYSLTSRGRRIVFADITSYSSEIVPIYFHQSGVYKETIKEIKDKVQQLVPQRFYITIKYFYSDYNNIFSVKRIQINDNETIKPNHRFSIIIITNGFPSAIFIWFLLRGTWSDAYGKKVNIVKPALTVKHKVSKIENMKDFIGGMFGEVVMACDENKMKKDIEKYSNLPMQQKRYKKGWMVGHYDGALSKNPHTAFTSSVLHLFDAVCFLFILFSIFFYILI